MRKETGVDGFRVDPAALSRTADGLRAAIGTAPGIPAQAVGVPAEAFGHAGLADVVGGFHSRWADGVTALTADAREVAARLARCIEDYRSADRLPSAPPSAIAPPEQR